MVSWAQLTVKPASGRDHQIGFDSQDIAPSCTYIYNYYTYIYVYIHLYTHDVSQIRDSVFWKDFGTLILIYVYHSKMQDPRKHYLLNAIKHNQLLGGGISSLKILMCVWVVRNISLRFLLNWMKLEYCTSTYTLIYMCMWTYAVNLTSFIRIMKLMWIHWLDGILAVVTAKNDNTDTRADLEKLRNSLLVVMPPRLHDKGLYVTIYFDVQKLLLFGRYLSLPSIRDPPGQMPSAGQVHELKMYFAGCPKPLGNRGDIHTWHSTFDRCYPRKERNILYTQLKSYVHRDVSNKVWYSSAINRYAYTFSQSAKKSRCILDFHQTCWKGLIDYFVENWICIVLFFALETWNIFWAEHQRLFLDGAFKSEDVPYTLAHTDTRWILFVPEGVMLVA